MYADLEFPHIIAPNVCLCHETQNAVIIQPLQQELELQQEPQQQVLL